MPLKGIFASIFLCALGVCATSVRAFDPEQLPTVTANVRGVLAEVDALLAANPAVAESWQTFLGLGTVRKQLDLGPDADPQVLAVICRRLEKEFPGSERRQIQAFATHLQKWHDILKRPQARELWQQAQAEATAFRPVSAADVERDRQNCLTQLNNLDQLLLREGTNGSGWRKRLLVDQVLTAVRNSDWEKLPSDVGHLWRAATAIWPSKTLIAAHNSLRQYEVTRIRWETKETATTFQHRLQNLAEAYRLWRENPTPERQLQLSTLVHELEVRGQAAQLTRVVRYEHSRPNLVVRASAPFVAKQTQRPVADSFPVNDTIVGTPVSGNASVRGEAYLQVVPSETAANLDIQFTADMFSETSAYSRGVQVDTEGTTRLFGQKRIFLDGLGLRYNNANVTADSNVELQGIYGGPLRRRIANNVYHRQQDQAKAEAEAKAAQRTAERLDQEVKTFQQKMLAGQTKRYTSPLFSANLEVGRQWRTSTSAVEGRFWSADPHEFAATSVAPGIDLGKGVSFQVHETYLERSMRERLGGKTVQASELADELSQMFAKLSSDLPDDTSDNDWAVTFSKEPVRVKFADDTMQITMFVEEFKSEKGEFPGIQVTAQYAVVCEKPALILQRVGQVEVLPVNYRTDSSATITGRQQVLRHFIQRQFGNYLRNTLHLGSIEPSPRNGLKEPLDFVESRTKEGWMSVLMEPPATKKR